MPIVVSLRHGTYLSTILLRAIPIYKARYGVVVCQCFPPHRPCHQSLAAHNVDSGIEKLTIRVRETRDRFVFSLITHVSSVHLAFLHRVLHCDFCTIPSDQTFLCFRILLDRTQHPLDMAQYQWVSASGNYRSQRIGPHEWSIHKEEICWLYKERNKTLWEVMTTMAARYGFTAR